MAAELDEFDLIARHFAPLAKAGVDVETFNLQDDAATIRSRPGKRLVVTSDSLVSGVHFFGDEPPAQIAQKALRANLSDLAGKGAQPVGYTLSLHLPSDTGDDWLADFASGLAQDQKTYGITLLGGDTTASRTLAIAITAIGEVAATYPARLAAKVSDDIWVTGTIGDAAMGLKLYEGTLAVGGDLGGEHGDFLRDRYRLPQPRLKMASIIAAHANGAMDVSDGLLADLAKMCRAAVVSAQIRQADLPISPAARAALEVLPHTDLSALFAGDDYEVLFTADSEARLAIEELASALPFGVTRIGHITDAHSSGEVLLMDEQGNPVQLESTGHTHRF
ncbi:MAG: thiamine-phosphate kinase [Pseudomonadota bacterium]